MSGRRHVQQAHERAQVAIFLEWFNRCYRSQFRVIAEPNPPEAVVQSGKTVRWVEVSTAFWSDEYAQDEYSYVTPGEKHRPISKGPFVNVDAQFSRRFVSVVKKKLEKKSYLPCKAKYGPGYLVIPILFPFFDGRTYSKMREEWSHASINDLGCFRAAFITFRSLNGTRVQRWSLS